MSRRLPSLLVALAALVAPPGAGCAGQRHYVWVEELHESAPPVAGDYVIGVGDQLSIRVYGQDAISAIVRVREDGRITLPLVNDPVAAGLSPSTLAELLRAELKTYVNKPVVTVSLEERRPMEVSVLGAVVIPGVFRVGPGSGLLHALALAGGITARADVDRIFVIRSTGNGGAPLRIRFRYRTLLASDGPSASFVLQDADVVMVE